MSKTNIKWVTREELRIMYPPKGTYRYRKFHRRAPIAQAISKVLRTP